MLNGQVSFRSPVELKRGVGMLNLLLWPGILCLTSSRARLGLAAVGIVTTLVAPHDTSILAILAALATIAIFSISARAAKTVVVAGWIACTLFIVPIAGLAYKADLHLANWLPVNARARIIIWAATAEATRKAPWLGIGADATKILIKTSDAGEKRADHVLDWNTGRHAHDVYLQVWYELGLVGALLLSGFGLSILRAIDRLEGDAQRLALCTFASAAVIASFSWGVWQSWYLAAFAASATAAAVAIRPSSMGSTNIA